MLDTSNSAWLVYAPDNGLTPLCVCDTEATAYEVAHRMTQFVDDYAPDETPLDAARKMVRFCPLVHGGKGEGAV